MKFCSHLFLTACVLLHTLFTLPVAATPSTPTTVHDDCTFCLPACKQPRFLVKLRSNYTISILGKVLTNDTTVCTSVCDGKGIALGNLKTLYSIRVKRVFFPPSDTTATTTSDSGTVSKGDVLQMAGIRTFATDALRTGVRMNVGDRYWITASMDDVDIDGFVIDRCVTATPWEDLKRWQKRRLKRGIF